VSDTVRWSESYRDTTATAHGFRLRVWFMPSAGYWKASVEGKPTTPRGKGHARRDLAQAAAVRAAKKRAEEAE
jgi:hypothetical protein